MATVHDVAKYILEQSGPVTTMKLQKLVYYSQAWHLVWAETPLFESKIQAWANGPVAPDLYTRHRGLFEIRSTDMSVGSSDRLSTEERSTVDAVLQFYGNKSGQWLSDLTHREPPWRRVREKAGLRPGERCSEEITLASMAEYYGSLADG